MSNFLQYGTKMVNINSIVKTLTFVLQYRNANDVKRAC